MNNLFFGGLIFLLSFLYVDITSAWEMPKRYPDVISGIIKYNVSGMNQGTEVVYFDNWGRREAKYTNTTMSMMGISQKTNSLTILTEGGEWIYNIDLDKRTGTKIKNPMFEKLAGKSESAKFGEDMMKAMGGERAGTEKVAGKTCNVWVLKIANTKSCIWKGITLKSEIEMGPMGMIIVATEVKEWISILDEKFKIPPDIKIQMLDKKQIGGNMRN